MDKRTIYTLGYTLFQKGHNIELDKMFGILKNYAVDFLVDVRSVPYSKQYPQCNAENLKFASWEFDITYLHMPEVGAKASPMQDVFSKASDIFFEKVFPIAKSYRPENTELEEDDEIVDFNKFRKEDCFSDGLRRIETAYDKGYTLALMCSEKNPIDCHRYFLISRALNQMFGEWLNVEHIVRNAVGEFCTISNKDADAKLQKHILDKKCFVDILQPRMFGEAAIDNYYGETLQDKITDFCDRYWNLMHGWRKPNNNIMYNENKGEYYD